MLLSEATKLYNTECFLLSAVKKEKQRTGLQGNPRWNAAHDSSVTVLQMSDAMPKGVRKDGAGLSTHDFGHCFHWIL